jgi:hypothetical protein
MQAIARDAIMIASDFKLVPLPILEHCENAVLRRLDSLPFVARKDLLRDPQHRYPYLYFLLFSQWPELVGHHEKVPQDDAFYNAYYWLLRLSKQYQLQYGFDAGLEQQATQVLETADFELDLEVVHELEERVTAEIPVAFSDFSIGEVKRRFAIQLDESEDLFANVAPVAPGSLLAETLRENIPLALAIGTEKARSELIVAPVLVEVRRQLAHAISLFSGVEWNVDPAQGLRGVCDFLFSLSPEQFDIGRGQEGRHGLGHGPMPRGDGRRPHLQRAPAESDRNRLRRGHDRQRVAFPAPRPGHRLCRHDRIPHQRDRAHRRDNAEHVRR